MFDWALLWGVGAVVASVLVARWYGRSWRALAEALSQQERRGAPLPPAEAAVDGTAAREEPVGVR